MEGISPQIESILSAGNRASSNLNSQPWRFVINGEHIEVHILPEADQSLYNWDQRLSYFTIGGLLENMVIAASAVDYKAEIAYFPAGMPTCVAAVNVTAEPGIKKDPLEPEIFLRSTDMKDFVPLKMSDQEKIELISAATADNTMHVFFIDERKDMRTLAEVAALNVQLIFSNKALHNFFFEHINWTASDEEQKKTGIRIDALELSAFNKALYYIFQNWEFLQPFTGIGIPKLIAGSSKSSYETASAMGCITTASEDPIAYLAAGRAFERLWLTAIQTGLNIQPLNELPYLKLRIDAKDTTDFSASQIDEIESAYKTARNIFGTEGERIACMFRIGSGAPSRQHSSRRELSQIVTIA
jgi:hypothetical protein